MHWNGAAWSIVASPNPGVANRELYGVRALSTSDAWAVGWYTDSAFVGEPLALHWNGTAWSQVATPEPGTLGSQFTAVAGASPGDVWAVGECQNSGDPRGTTHPLAMHWNGTAWTEVPTAPLPGAGISNNYFYGVAGAAGDQVWAGGYQSMPGIGPQPMVQRWNGAAFVNEAVPVLPAGGALHAAAAASGATGSGPTVFTAGTHSDVSTGTTSDRTLVIRGIGG